MNKLTYEEWKEKYCAKISQEQLEDIKNLHGLEDPKSLVEQSNLEAYEKYVGEFWSEHWEGLVEISKVIAQKNWLDLLGDIQYNESVDGNNIVREIGPNEFKILWSFENNLQARESFEHWYEQYQDYFNNPENYKK